jgi:hypothetical protein
VSRRTDGPAVHLAAQPRGGADASIYMGRALCGAGNGRDRDGEERARYMAIVNDPARADCRRCLARVPFQVSTRQHRIAVREGWYIFSGNDGDFVQRIDDRDDGRDPLTDDDQAIALALAAGVPCDPTTGELYY